MVSAVLIVNPQMYVALLQDLQYYVKVFAASLISENFTYLSNVEELYHQYILILDKDNLS